VIGGRGNSLSRGPCLFPPGVLVRAPTQGEHHAQPTDPARHLRTVDPMRGRLLALGFAPALLIQQCAPECAPQPPAAVATNWTVNWDNVAQCESGQNWSHRPVTNSSGTYSGGLMIGHRWWNAHGGGEFASAPYLASKSQQIIVAERIVDANGDGYAGADKGWQCVR